MHAVQYEDDRLSCYTATQLGYSYMRRLEPERPAVQVSLRLQPSLARALTRRAKREKVTRSELIRSLLAAGLEDWPSLEGELRGIRDELQALRQEVRRGRPKKRKGRAR